MRDRADPQGATPPQPTSFRLRRRVGPPGPGNHRRCVSTPEGGRAGVRDDRSPSSVSACSGPAARRTRVRGRGQSSDPTARVCSSLRPPSHDAASSNTCSNGWIAALQHPRVEPTGGAAGALGVPAGGAGGEPPRVRRAHRRGQRLVTSTVVSHGENWGSSVRSTYRDRASVLACVFLAVRATPATSSLSNQ